MADTLDLTVDAKLLAEAEGLGIDVAQEIEIHLRSRIEKRKREMAWREENHDAVEQHNAWIERNGLWYDHLRNK